MVGTHHGRRRNWIRKCRCVACIRFVSHSADNRCLGLTYQANCQVSKVKMLDRISCRGFVASRRRKNGPDIEPAILRRPFDPTRYRKMGNIPMLASITNLRAPHHAGSTATLKMIQRPAYHPSKQTPLTWKNLGPFPLARATSSMG